MVPAMTPRVPGYSNVDPAKGRDEGIASARRYFLTDIADAYHLLKGFLEVIETTPDGELKALVEKVTVAAKSGDWSQVPGAVRLKTAA
jgi:hypothetical protein